MENLDFEVEIQETDDNDNDSIQLPLNFLSLGEIENDDVKVYIKQDVYKSLEKLASSDTTKELGSIILGDYSEDLGKTNVVISDFIEAKYTDASASTLTFTHETWDYVHKEHEKKFSDKKIVGWQHTHPSYGIFLSNYDMFIQENFFNLPFQVAYVIDPIQNLRGFFQWKNGKVEKLKGYYIYDDVGKTIKIEQEKPKKQKEEKAEEKQKSNKALVSVISILCVACLVLGISLISLKKDYNECLAKQSEIVNEVNELLERQNTLISQQLTENSGSLQNSGASSENKGQAVLFTAYTVQAGDTIFSICTQNGIDYASNLKIILAINGIEDANKIYEGQKLLLPTSQE